MTKAKMS